MKLNRIFPVSRSLVSKETWEEIKKIWEKSQDADNLPDSFFSEIASLRLPGAIPDLIRLELAIYQTQRKPADFTKESEKIALNPTLQVLSFSWKNLPLFIKQKGLQTPSSIQLGPEWVLIWQDPNSRELQFETASEEELLALKMLVEGLEVEEVARMGSLPITHVEKAIDRSVAKGILISSPSKIRRDPQIFPQGKVTQEHFFSSPVFTLQWHITQACDLHCLHCYDRSSRLALSLGQSLEILEDLRHFCRSQNVRGHISFTGGNPFLNPNFFAIYQAAFEKGFSVAILGNPVAQEKIEKISSIQNPTFYQVSLEGLPEHNDHMRENGHFDRTMRFLALLKDRGIYSMVMLTLTRDNLNQVLPLAEILRDKTEAFFFNRLSMVGEASKLLLPTPGEFQQFLRTYLQASRENPILGLKDNLFNILFYRNGGELFGGCAGYGCSAAFNFLTLLPDGEVHACRKFPSPIGNISNQSFEELYTSKRAKEYRAGSKACAPCPIRPVCGGCLAVSSSLGLDIFEDRDPFCFFE